MSKVKLIVELLSLNLGVYQSLFTQLKAPHPLAMQDILSSFSRCICFLLICDKLPEILQLKTGTGLFGYSFCESGGVRTQLYRLLC